MEPVRAKAKSFQVIAHRGVCTHADDQRIAPENTIPAFEEAQRLGAAIELDVMTTADGLVVVHHDFELGRIFALPGKTQAVNEIPWAVLQTATLNVEGHEESVNKKLTSESAYTTPAQFRQVRIPTLEAVLDAVPDTHVYIELKARDGDANASLQLEAQVAKLIQEKNLYHRVTVISFSVRSLRKIKRLDPQIQTGLNVDVPRMIKRFPLVLPLWMRWYVKQWVGADSLQPSYDDTTLALVRAAHGAGLSIISWVKHQTRDEEAALFSTLMRMGVDGLMTNAVDLLLQELEKQGKSG